MTERYCSFCGSHSMEHGEGPVKVFTPELLRWLKVNADQVVSVNGVDITEELRFLAEELK